MADIIDPFKQQASSGIRDPFQAAATTPATPAAEAPKPKLTRSLGEVATDTLSGVAKGAVDIAKSAHQITSLANPATIARGAASKLSRAAFGRDLVPTESEALSTAASAASRLVGGGDVQVQSRADMLGSATEALERSQSPILQRKKQELADTKGFFASARKVVTDPVLLGNFAAEQVPNLVGMGYGTAASGAGAAARAGAPVLQRALASGATREAAHALAGKAGAEAGKQAAERFVLGSNTLFEAGSAADQAYRDALSQPDEVWQANPEFQRELAAGTPAERIKERMAQEAGARAAAITAPIAAVAGKLVAPFEADVFAGRLARTPTAVLTGAAREAGEEGIQEGGSQFAGNLAMQDVDPTRGLLEGVPEAAGTGAALGGLLGGGLAVGGAVANTESRGRRSADAPPLPEPNVRRPMLALPAPTFAVDSQGQASTSGQADAQMRQDVADVQAREDLGLTPDVNRARREHPGAVPNAGMLTRPSVPYPDAAPGSLSDIANLVADVQVVQTPDAGAGQPSAKGKGRTTGAGEAPTAADAVPAGYVPRWVDKVTGEVREPSFDEVKAEIHQSANFMSENGTGMWRPAIARALGLKSRQFDAAWNEVVRERKQGLIAPAPAQENNDGITAADAADPAPGIAQADQPETAGIAEAAPESTGAADTAAVPAAGRAVVEEGLPAAQEPAGDHAQAGVRAPEAVAPAPATAAQEGAPAAVYDESDEVLETDITPPSGGPFTQRGAADAQARRHEGGRVFEVEGGFVVRTPQAIAVEESDTAAPATKVPEPAVRAADVPSLAPESPQPGTEEVGQIGQSETEPVQVPTDSTSPPPGAESAPDQTSGKASRVPAASSGTVAGSPAQATPAPSGPQPMVRVRAGKPYYDATHRKTLQAYFQPGREIAGYGVGRDRVLEFRDNDGTGRWAVRVQAIDKDGNPAVESGTPAQPRWHSTVPMDRELRAVFGAPQKKARAAANKAAPVAATPDLRNSANPAAAAPSVAPVATAAAEAATSPTNDRPEPTQAQKDAGNYKKGHIRINGHDISIENPAGSKRRPEWPALKNHYGYFKGTIGKDKDHVDVFMTERAHDPSLPVFVVDQVNQDGSFDEHKVIMGSPSEAAARRAYLSNYSRGWTGLGAITQFTQEDFKAWLGDDKKTKRPAGKLAKPAAPANDPVTPGVKADKPAKAGITDSGEQLRNNNRNRYGGIQWSDVEGLNDTAKVKAITRDAIWPQPDWTAIAKEEGVLPWRVLVAKRVRSMIGKAPATRGAPSDAELQAYLEAVNRVREATEAYMREPAAGAEPGGLGRAVLSKLIPNISAARGVAGWSQNPDEAQLVRLIGGNRFLRAVQRERVQADAMSEAASSGWPNAEPAAKQEAWQRRFRIAHSDMLVGFRDARPGDDRYGYYVVKGATSSASARKVAGPFITEEQAIEEARVRAKPQQHADAGGIALGDVVREGAPRRDGDATPDQLREVFGFRGVNFGNWVNQTERQAHLNHAYDAFADLAELLDIPPRAISLNGLLGVAFGAQGKGRAAAHFVPGDNEINITKTAGAGALAHEWGHALDHYFAVQSGKSAARARRPYMTELLGNAGPGVRPEVVAAFRDVVETMQNRPLTDEQRAAETSAARQRHAAASDFHRASRALDSTRQKPYWSTPWEMFARALESWALNRLAEQDRRSDYLVKPNLEDDAWKGAYPLGDDVKRIGAAFDRLFATIQSEPTAAGNVRLFSLSPPTQSQAFKDWFGDSKVVDSEGQPRVVYHGSGVPISEFRTDAFFTSSPAAADGYAMAYGSRQDRAGEIEDEILALHDRLEALPRQKRPGGRQGIAAQVDDYLEGGEPAAEERQINAEIERLRQELDGIRKAAIAGDGASVSPVFLSIKNPLVIDLGRTGRGVHTTSEIERISAAIDRAKRAGNDGVIARNTHDSADSEGTDAHDVYVAFRPEQVKSAIGNRGTFDPTDSRIHFSKGQDHQGINFDRAMQLKRELTAKWGDRAPNVVMIQNAEAFPDSAKVDPEYRRGEGFFNGRDTVWINVERIPTEDRLRQVLAHEALGHYGVEQVVGQAQWDGIVQAITSLEASGKASAQTQAVFADVRRRYGAVDATTFAKEAIAVMAERGIRNTFVQRLVAAVRRFLRNLMPSQAWSEGDIRGLLSAADSFLRAGRDQARRQADVQAYAFSRPDAEGSVAGDGQRSIRMGGQTFVERSGTFYMVNGTGHPKDFSVFSQALDTAASTGGEVRLDDAIEGQRPTYSVVVPEAVARGAFAGRGNFSLPPRPVGPTFAEQVQERLQSNDARGGALDVGRTPAVLRMLGFPELNLSMSAGVLHKIAGGKGGTRAEIPARTIGRFPELLDDPVAVFDSQEQDSLMVVTRAVDSINNPIVVVLRPNGMVERAPANVLVTAYGKVEASAWAQQLVDAGRLRYLGDAKNPRLPQSSLAQSQTEAGSEGSEGRKVLSAADLRNFRAAQRAQSFSGPGLFSKAPADIVADIEAVSNPGRDQGALERAKAWLADVTPKKLKDQTRGAWLGALTTRHLTELGGDYFQNIKHYSDYLSEMQADRNALQAEGEGIAEAARKWASKNQAAARAMFDLMHDATIDGVDPAEAYQSLQFRYGGELHDATPKKVKEAIRAVHQQMRERSAENKTDLMNEVKVLRSLPARERARAAKYPTLVQRWNQLPPEAQEHYRAFRDLYKKRSGQVEQALIDRINDTDAPDQHKRRIIDVIRRQFESNRLQGVYFPLQRFGRYFVAAEKAGTPTFLMFERLNDLERAVRDLKARGFTIKAQGLKQAGKAQDAPSGTFVAEVIGALKNAHVSEATQDQIYQLYLQSLPEMSMRKHQIHRQSVPGWDPDAVRAFAYNTHHGAHQLARMRFSHKLQAVLDLLKKQQDAARKEAGADTRKIAAGDAVLEELNRRHEWIMNPTDSQLTNLISSAGFLYYLGATPAAALVNLTQTALVSYPFLAARYGGIKAMNALLAASRDAVRTVGNIQKTLKDPEEQAAHKALMASGALDKTQAHNLAGIAEGGLQGYNPAWARAMEIIGWGFHKTEVVNREATGLAAFRLARASGATFNEAVKLAHDAIFDTHFDYSNANRARFMQSGAAKVLLMFRQYSLNMTWMLGRSVWLATRGASPEVKRIARRQLAGVLGMSAVFSGTLGLPMAGVVAGVLNSLQATFGDDDEPWDAETEFGAFLTDMLGPTAAQVVLHGAANQVTGADIAGRVGLSDLWFRDADRELEGRGLYYNLLEQAAGPMGGVLKNAVVGKNMIDQGQTWRGVETMLPKALKDMLKGARYAAEGVNTLRGDALLEDRSLGDALLQVAGFSPARVAERYDRNRALTNYEDHIMRRRQSLMDSFAMALRLGDEEARAAALGKIQGFNRANPEVAITTASIRRSIASRARYSAKAEGGVVLNPKLAARLKATVGGD